MRKPFFRQFTKSWYVTLDGQQVPLGRNKEQAFQKYHELMAQRGQGQQSFAMVAELFDAYLEWLHNNRSEGTYNKCRYYLSLFVRFIGKKQRLERLQGVQVIQWIESKASWSPTTGHDACSTVQRAFNWAVKRGHISHSPVAKLEDKPKARRRETVCTPAEWKELRCLVTDQAFGDLLDFLWATGCRPLEARTMCARHVDLTNAVVIFPPSEAKGEHHERVIFLPDDALAICTRLVEKHPTGEIFRNTRGRPWTKDSINCRFQRLKHKLKRPMNAYAIRHSFATEALKTGMDSLTVAQIMGHADTSMLARHYAHLARNPNYLREQARKLRSPDAA